MSPRIHRLEAIVRGRVQGVGFRYFVIEQADRLGLRGYVRNLPTGAVEVVAEGAEPSLQELRRQLSRGPIGAHVTSVDDRFSDSQNEFHRFEVRW